MDSPTDMHAAAYARHLQAKNRAQRTIDGYLWWIDDLAQWLDGEDITLADQADMEDYFGHLLEQLADTSVGVAFRSLRAFFNWAAAEEIISRSPMARMFEPTMTDRPPAIVPDEDLRALLKACEGTAFVDRRDMAMIRLFCEPGSPRRAEMASIRLDGLDLRGCTVTFVGKGARQRTVPFGRNTGVALDRYLRVRTRHHLAALPQLWLGQRGKALTDWGIRQMLLRRCTAAGIGPIRPHQLRHSSYHAFRSAGGTEDDAESLYGWTPGSRMSRVYGRSMRHERARKRAAELSVADRL